MKHARADYDRIQDPAGKIAADEPVFLLRAQDRSAPQTLRFWAGENARNGGDPALSRLADGWAGTMEQWQRANRSKPADLGEGAAAAPSTQGAAAVVQMQDGNQISWRDLAYKFDGHRMQALWHLRAFLADPEKHAPYVIQFLSAAPLSGEKVLAQRVAQHAAKLQGKPYAYEYGKSNGDGTYSVVIDRGSMVQVGERRYEYGPPRDAIKEHAVQPLHLPLPTHLDIEQPPGHLDVEAWARENGLDPVLALEDPIGAYQAAARQQKLEDFVKSAGASPAAKADESNAAALVAEALAVFDLMLEGCRDRKFGDYQNGDGEEIGPRMDALHARLRAYGAGAAPKNDA